MFLNPNQFKGLLFTDFDGTVAPHGSNAVSGPNINAITSARAAGFGVVCTTGRTWSAAQPLYEMGLFDGLVFNDGASVVADAASRNIATIDRRSVETVVYLAAERGLGLFGDGFDGFGFADELVRSPIDKEHPRILVVLPRGTSDSFRRELEETKQIHELPVDIHDEKPTGSGYDVLRISPQNVSKTYGIASLCGKALNFSLCGAVGDHYNDATLLAEVDSSGGVARAMGNAPEDLLPHIRRVPTVSNNGAAVAIQHMIERLG